MKTLKFKLLEKTDQVICIVVCVAAAAFLMRLAYKVVVWVFS